MGKTSLLKELLRETKVKVGGFISEDIREKGERVGFRIRTLGGKEGILAHKDIKSPWRVGKYGVNVKDIEEIGVRAIEEAIRDSDIVVIDEIGKMELFSPLFRQCVRKALDSEKPLLGTLHRAREPFLDAIRARQDTIVLWLTPQNREEVFQKVRCLLEEVC